MSLKTTHESCLANIPLLSHDIAIVVRIENKDHYWLLNLVEMIKYLVLRFENVLSEVPTELETDHNPTQCLFGTFFR